MEEDLRTKPFTLTTAICELNNLQRCDDLTGPSNVAIPSTSKGIRGFRSVGVPTIDSEGIYTLNNRTNDGKLQMSLNPRYISKITNNPRKICDSSLRMRPYFIPERTRTKSENNVETLPNFSSDFCHFTNNNSNSSMMETCDGYGNMDNINPGHGNNFLGLFSGGSSGNVPSSSSRQLIKPIAVLKKSRSLENVRAENLDGSQPSHEMEFVSSRIQKLKVRE